MVTDVTGRRTADDTASRRAPYERWLILAIAVIIVPVSLLVYENAKREILLHRFLSGDDYSVVVNPATKGRVCSIVPRIIAYHRHNVTASQGFSAQHLEKMKAFNARIASWHGLLSAYEVSGSEEAESYIVGFIASESALNEEITSGTQAVGANCGHLTD